MRLHAGPPIVGIDLGAGRAWSAAVAIWQSGRREALAVAPGIPSIDGQEKRDRVPAGLCRRLVNDSRLLVAEGLRVQPAGQLVDAVFAAWGRPAIMMSDRARYGELLDAVAGRLQVQDRVTRWFGARRIYGLSARWRRTNR